MNKFILLLINLYFLSIKGEINTQNSTNTFNEHDWDNATWVLTSSFIIITMQSGFGLLESGLVSKKNNTHIMIKNITDIIFGGLTFWIFGYSIIFGKNSNGFGSYQNFFNEEDDNFGWLFANFFFQLTFSTTATTIVSGCLAERTKFLSYLIFSTFNTFIYIFPAHWVWNDKGWLKKMGVIDFAGSGPVHLMGGLTGLVGTFILKPRLKINKPSCTVNALLGLFMLWWGWLGFNCGSTLGITEYKWLYASKAAVTTVISSIGGGITGILYSWFFFNNKLIIDIIINSILGSLVSITACCIYVSTPESFLIGAIGALVTIKSNDYIKYCNIDDPVGGIGAHAFSSIWGIISAALFTQKKVGLDIENGLFYGGGFKLLGVQLLEIISISVWSLTISFIFFKGIDLTLGLRLTEDEEEMGADILYHLEENDEIFIIDENFSIENIDGEIETESREKKKISISISNKNLELNEHPNSVN